MFVPGLVRLRHAVSLCDKAGDLPVLLGSEECSEQASVRSGPHGRRVCLHGVPWLRQAFVRLMNTLQKIEKRGTFAASGR